MRGGHRYQLDAISENTPTLTSEPSLAATAADTANPNAQSKLGAAASTVLRIRAVRT